MSEHKARRNSFFFFSSSSKSEPKRGIQFGALKPLDKYPLKHSQPRSHSGTETIIHKPVSSSTQNDEKKGAERQTSSGGHRAGRYSKVPLSAENQLSNMRRPPPPPVDLENSLSRPAESAHTTENKALKDFGSEESYGEGDVTYHSHKRNKSELDQLMDELDHFEAQRRRNLEEDNSFGVDAVNEDFQTRNILASDSEIDLESPIIDVRSLRLTDSRPHSIKSTNSGPSIMQLNEANKPHPESSGDDQFSFADSQAESVREVDYVPFNNDEDVRQAYPSFDYSQGSQSSDTASSQLIRGYYRKPSEKKTQSTFGDDHSIVEQPRQLRVVNDHKPNFLMHDESSNTEDESICYSAEEVSSLPLNDAFTMPAVAPTPAALSDSATGLFEANLSMNEGQSISAPIPSSGDDKSLDPIQDTSATPTRPHTNDSRAFNPETPNRTGTEKSVRLVSSYVEELRLKYFPTSNTLQPPPDLPFSLKTKNNLEQPQNIKVRIRTSSRQIGIKHGKAKQKLLSLETAKEDNSPVHSGLLADDDQTISTKVDHTREFRNLLGRNNNEFNRQGHGSASSESGDDEELYLQNIPGDEAYDSDDVMAPLREKRGHSGIRFDEDAQVAGLNGGSNGRVGRSDTVTSYFTRKANRRRTGTLDIDYSYIPPIKHPSEAEGDPSRQYAEHNSDAGSSDDALSVQTSNSAYYKHVYNGGLHITNKDPGPD
ncbi:LAQU0S16e00496g1_1 [Lachancea quebecensis]|uniref:LAQU0S16e00496g1_1 n=1 Tax=Lachancea quebecensis TaxID=1654605 RepID=A0A0P1KWY2_9SACH|nr:LAQU0S16e00496g1_1 [Lachancea quebecensis]